MKKLMILGQIYETNDEMAKRLIKKGIAVEVKHPVDSSLVTPVPQEIETMMLDGRGYEKREILLGFTLPK